LTCRKPSAILWSIATTGFSTGMAAISNALFTLVEPGDRVVSIKDTYGGTSKVFLEMLPEAGVEVALCETEDYDEIERQVADLEQALAGL
jgi:cystathionine gamma-synthase